MQLQLVEHAASKKGASMLWTITVLLLILWLLGMVSSYTLGGFIHILLVLAVVAVLIRLIQGRSPVL
jgi:asparagine N-glycosylation enzyme membrane subunit Stt3